MFLQNAPSSLYRDGRLVDRRECYILGVAYGLLPGSDDANGGYIPAEILRRWPKMNAAEMVECSSDSNVVGGVPRITDERRAHFEWFSSPRSPFDARGAKNQSVEDNEDEEESLKDLLYRQKAAMISENDVPSMNVDNLPITEGHTGNVVGKVTKHWTKGTELWVHACISDLDCAQKVRGGEYGSFSVGYKFRITPEGKVKDKTFDHLAICERPVFKNCTYSVVASNEKRRLEGRVTAEGSDYPNDVSRGGGGGLEAEGGSILDGLNIKFIADSPVDSQNNFPHGDMPPFRTEETKKSEGASADVEEIQKDKSAEEAGRPLQHQHNEKNTEMQAQQQQQHMQQNATTSSNPSGEPGYQGSPPASGGKTNATSSSAGDIQQQQQQQRTAENHDNDRDNGGGRSERKRGDRRDVEENDGSAEDSLSQEERAEDGGDADPLSLLRAELLKERAKRKELKEKIVEQEREAAEREKKEMERYKETHRPRAKLVIDDAQKLFGEETKVVEIVKEAFSKPQNRDVADYFFETTRQKKLFEEDANESRRLLDESNEKLRRMEAENQKLRDKEAKRRKMVDGAGAMSKYIKMADGKKPRHQRDQGGSNESSGLLSRLVSNAKRPANPDSLFSSSSSSSSSKKESHRSDRKTQRQYEDEDGIPPAKRAKTQSSRASALESLPDNVRTPMAMHRDMTNRFVAVVASRDRNETPKPPAQYDWGLIPEVLWEPLLRTRNADPNGDPDLYKPPPLAASVYDPSAFYVRH